MLALTLNFVLFMHIGNEYIMLDYDFDPKLFLCAMLLGRAQFKPLGVKKELCPIYD